DVLHGDGSDRRIGIRLQCRGPLTRVLRVAPSGPMRFDVGSCRIPERDRLRLFESHLLFGTLAGFQRVDPFLPQLPAFARELPGGFERDSTERAKAHFARYAPRSVRLWVASRIAGGGINLRHPVAEDPRARAGTGDLQIEAPAIPVHAWRLRLCDSERLQLPDRAHSFLLSTRKIPTVRIRIVANGRGLVKTKTLEKCRILKGVAREKLWCVKMAWRRVQGSNLRDLSVSSR